MTLAPSYTSYTSVGGSQIALTTSAAAGTWIVDAQGQVSSFALDPAPVGSVFAPTAGGIVAYIASGAVYAVKTK